MPKHTKILYILLSLVTFSKGNVGEKIQSRGLEPLDAIKSMSTVLLGIDGTTIATLHPSDKEIIVRNGRYHTCSGSINRNTGRCSDTLEELPFQKQEDFCLLTANFKLNGYYCLAPSNLFSGFAAIGNKVYCETVDDTPKLLIRADEFNNLCRNIASSITYRYFTRHPQVFTGNGITCSGRNPQVCTLSRNLDRRGP